MQRDNVFRSSGFHMHVSDRLHFIVEDEDNSPFSVYLVNSSDPNTIEDGTPEAPVANEGIVLTSADGFWASWAISDRAFDYYLDVATDSAFTSFVPGYENYHIPYGSVLGSVIEVEVTGLASSSTYYYRVRANYDTSYLGTINNKGVSPNSNVVTVNTGTVETVVIGTQTWMLYNVNNGVSGSKIYMGYPEYGYRPIYGGLYRYDMAAAIEALYPGYHMPTIAEWATLITFLGTGTVAGGKMKETGITHWKTPNASADNSSGFTGLPGGAVSSTGFNFQVTEYGWFQSASSFDANQNWAVQLYYNSAVATQTVLSKLNYYSVRLIKT